MVLDFFIIFLEYSVTSLLYDGWLHNDLWCSRYNHFHLFSKRDESGVVLINHFAISISYPTILNAFDECCPI